MKGKKFNKKQLIDLLVKKATGFFYEEEQLEYENKGSPSKNSQKLDSQKTNLKNSVTLSGNLDMTGGIIELSDKKKQSVNCNDDLILSKRKVNTHYIPPDMIAIKILFEIYEKKVDDNEISKLSDDELLKLKNKLLEELSNETN